MKIILTNEEAEALSHYFDITTVNITKLIKQMGLKKTKHLEDVIDKLVEFDKTKQK